MNPVSSPMNFFVTPPTPPQKTPQKTQLIWGEVALHAWVHMNDTLCFPLSTGGKLKRWGWVQHRTYIIKQDPRASGWPQPINLLGPLKDKPECVVNVITHAQGCFAQETLKASMEERKSVCCGCKIISAPWQTKNSGNFHTFLSI